MHGEPQHRTAAIRPDTEARDIQKHVQPQHKTPSKRTDPKVGDAQMHGRRDGSKTPKLSLQARWEQDKRGCTQNSRARHKARQQRCKKRDGDIHGISHGHPAHQLHRHQQSPRCKHERNREKRTKPTATTRTSRPQSASTPSSSSSPISRIHRRHHLTDDRGWQVRRGNIALLRQTFLHRPRRSVRPVNSTRTVTPSVFSLFPTASQIAPIRNDQDDLSSNCQHLLRFFLPKIPGVRQVHGVILLFLAKSISCDHVASGPVLDHAGSVHLDTIFALCSIGFIDTSDDAPSQKKHHKC